MLIMLQCTFEKKKTKTKNNENKNKSKVLSLNPKKNVLLIIIPL